jgi:hypothetical protein
MHDPLPAREPLRSRVLAPFNLFLILLLAGGGTLACRPSQPAPDADGEAPQVGLVLATPDATPGYVLFSPLLSSNTYLIDQTGDAVQVWESEYAPAGLYLLDDGSLLRSGRDPDALGFKAGGVTGIVQRIAWDGEVLWEWKHSTDTEILHHDIEPLPNGNFLALGWQVKSRDEALAAGRRADGIPEKGLWPEFVIEVEPLPENQARIVWRWDVWDHLVQDHDPSAANHGDPAARPERLDLNADAGNRPRDPEEIEQLKALGYVPEDADEEELGADFLHANAIAYHPGLDHIALSIPSLGEIWIIDHGITTEEARGPAGDLLYRWGNPAAYQRGEAADQRLFYQHDVEWIPDGWERAGNLTLFNNGGGRPGDENWSEVLEIEPPLEPDGTYRRGLDGVWGPAEPVWSYADRETFFAPFISGAQRLASGNTLVCSGPHGRFFEVTPDGKIVWEYRNPYHGNVRNRDGSPPQPVDEFHMAVFRATHVPPDHPALAGRELAPLDPQPAYGEPIEYPDEDREDTGQSSDDAEEGDDG